MTDSKTSPEEEEVPEEVLSEANTPDVDDTTVEGLAPEELAAADAAQDEAEQEDFKDQYLRLRADFENFRKRTRREKEEWTQRCLENICTDLMTILDHFDLGLENAKGKEFSEDTLKGFELISGQLTTVLGKYGLEAVEAKEGAFDPNLHEAITHMPSPEVPEGEIVAMTRKGYQMGAKLLRPAQVVVSAGEGEG